MKINKKAFRFALIKVLMKKLATASLLILLVVACSDATSPFQQCEGNEQPWSYSRADSNGVEVVHLSGCAEPEDISAIMIACLSGQCPEGVSFWSRRR